MIDTGKSGINNGMLLRLGPAIKFGRVDFKITLTVTVLLCLYNLNAIITRARVRIRGYRSDFP